MVFLVIVGEFTCLHTFLKLPLFLLIVGGGFFALRESGRLAEVGVEIKGKFPEVNVGEICREEIKIPRGFVCLVVHDPQSLYLFVREVVHANTGNGTELELLGS